MTDTRVTVPKIRSQLPALPSSYNARVGLPDRLERERRDQRFAMRLSLAFGVVMMVGKLAAYVLTGSAAIFSDAAESVIHVVAVSFAAFSLWLSSRPANHKFPYGYERITFFSAGFEGAMIVLAAIAIIYAAIHKWLAGLRLENLGMGTLFVLAAAVINAGLGWYLVRTGRRTHSLILEADGKHVLTDSWTSFGVVGGLCLVLLTGWKPFDPLCAIAVALNIVWSGGHLIWRSATGLLDYSDPEVGRKLRRGWTNSAQNSACNTTACASAPPATGCWWRSTCSSRTARRSARRIAWRRKWKNACRRAGYSRRSHYPPGIAGRPRQRAPRGALHRQAVVEVCGFPLML